VTIEELMLDEARRNLTRQEATLDGLRVRSTAVLSISAVIFAILGERQVGELDAWAILALISFVLSAGLAVFILYPREFEFGIKVQQWMGQIDRRTADAGVAAWDTAASLAGMQVANKDNIAILTQCYAAGCGFLVAQVIFWVVGGLN
jgi:hypothetical protein